MIGHGYKVLKRDADGYPSEGLFWTLAFAYAMGMALMLQKVVLPLWPAMHAGHGLLKNDAIDFHRRAVDLAAQIHEFGWSAWTLFPQGTSGNVGLLGAVYALFGPDPAWFLPLNAGAHAMGALLIYRLGARLAPGQVGRLGGLISGLCFLIFPSALQWYAQNHKDAVAITGLLLILDAWIDLQGGGLTRRSIAWEVGRGLLGVMALGIMRPYFTVVLLMPMAASFAARILVDLAKGRGFSRTHAVLAGLLCLSVVSAMLFQQTLRSAEVFENHYANGTPTATYAATFEWRSSGYLPGSLDRVLERASMLRTHYVAYGRLVGAGSEIDGDRQFDSALGALEYMPRALMVGLFAPFPNTWGERVTAPRLVVAVETAIWYFLALGIIVTVARRPSRELLAGAVFCAVLLTILAYVHPNVGTLYRQRVAPWHFFMLVGAVGWAHVIVSYTKRRKQAVSRVAPVRSSLGD